MMKIGVISDSHDRYKNLNNVIKILEKGNVKVLIHCGDFCAPSMIKEMAKFKGEVHCIFGNVDDRYTSTKIALESKNVKPHGDYVHIEIGNKKIGKTFLINPGELMEKKKNSDLLFMIQIKIKVNILN